MAEIFVKAEKLGEKDVTISDGEVFGCHVKELETDEYRLIGVQRFCRDTAVVICALWGTLGTPEGYLNEEEDYVYLLFKKTKEKQGKLV